MTKQKYTMKMSRLTVDKLGVKLYDKVSAVISELIANSYDADATEVKIVAPMAAWLATKSAGKLKDSNHEVKIVDNGTGMVPSVIDDFYLTVGGERRNDPKRGEISKKYNRKVMGRKGVGKLAPFGICKIIEVISSGGEKVSGKDKDGKDAKGYLTAHLILNYDKIAIDTIKPYNPTTGDLNGTVASTSGTEIRLSNFFKRRVSEISTFDRQIAQRFGIKSENWKITLIDNQKTDTDPAYSQVVGEFDAPVMENTKIEFNKNGEVKIPTGTKDYELKAGFDYEGTHYLVTGWVGYSKKPFKDELMAGVRIYCRGKIASQTSVFGRKAGFTGEYDIRSYLIGELHADWLDANEDLILTDRRDILWSDELGNAFQKWGRNVVETLGKLTRDPLRKKTWDSFKEKTSLDKKIIDAFPSRDQEKIRENAMEFASIFGKKIKESELEDQERLDDIAQMALTFAPYITMDNQLREAAKKDDNSLGFISKVLKTARVAELTSLGKLAADRVKVIKRLELLKKDESADEAEFQDLITGAPWLINPEWTPITANQSFSTFVREFKAYYKEQIGNDLEIAGFSKPTKRPDFILLNQDNTIHVVEIKQPWHQLEDSEMERIFTYKKQMEEFLTTPGNEEVVKSFKDFHITLVCKGTKLSASWDDIFQNLIKNGKLTHINWASFLRRTSAAHKDFLKESEKFRIEEKENE